MPLTYTGDVVSTLPLWTTLVTVLYDVTMASGISSAAPGKVRQRFENFLHFEDVSEFVPGMTVESPPWKAIVLQTLPLFAVLGQATVIVHSLIIGENDGVLQALLRFGAFLYASFRVKCKPPKTPPYWLLLFCVASLTSAIFSISTTHWPISFLGLPAIIETSVSLCLIYVIGTFPVRHELPSSNVALASDIPSNEKSMPEDSVTLWQWCTFSFIESIFRVASIRRLEPEDVWMLSPFFKHKNLFLKFLEYKDRYPGSSLLRLLIESNSLDLIINLFASLYIAVIAFVSIYSLQQILTILARNSGRKHSEVYLYAFYALVANVSSAQVGMFRLWHAKRSYQRTRGQLWCGLHYKALRRRDLNTATKTDKDNVDSISDSADLGKIVNLMRGDTYALAYWFWEPFAVLAATVRFAIALIFLHWVLGWSAMAGVVTVIVAYTVNYPVTKYNVYLSRTTSKAGDQRMSAVNELFQNIRFLKFYGWENHWASGVKDKRDNELSWRMMEYITATFISFIWIWVPSAMAFFCFLFYTVVGGGHLTVSKTFTTLSLLGMLQAPMMELPGQIISFLHAYVALQRIDAFLNEDEVEPWASSLSRNPKSTTENALTPARNGPDTVGFSNAILRWNGNVAETTNLHRESFELGPLNISFPAGKLSLVTGVTGVGKSALLMALLGELYTISGDVIIDKSRHKVAFCAQNPWLQQTSIRENIIFGSRFKFDEARYEAVIDACDLSRDLDMFDAGDMTEIGDKGVSLSGGQRARVALARAVYSEAQCVLLDDPLAAVDMHTAQHIVERCFRGNLMRDRTVILVTHHISLCLSSASFLVELSGGKAVHQGSVEDLQKSGVLKTVISTEDLQETPADPVESGHTLENEADSISSSDDSTIVPSQLKPQINLMGKGKSGKLIEEETRAEGRVSLRTYMTYIRAAGWFSWVFTFTLMVLVRLLAVAKNLFLAKWSMAYDERRAIILGYQVEQIVMGTPLSGLPSPGANAVPWLLIYLAVTMAGAFATLIHIALGYFASLRASRALFMKMLLRLVKAPIRFFDTTPNGRIFNRFTSDISIIDSTLQNSARSAILGGLSFIASFLFIIWVVPAFTSFAVFIAFLYIRLAPRFVRAARDLRRLESISLSPAFQGFDELMRGLSHVRAFAMEDRFQEVFYQKVDRCQAYDHAYWTVTNWLQWRYDCLGALVVFVSTVFALWLGVSDGFAAIVILQAGLFADASRYLVGVAAQLELDFNSVERVGEYLDVVQEAPSLIEENRPPAYWPSDYGPLVVEDLVVRYAPHLPPILNGVSFTANPGEKIGVVGRTGSGKSTLALSLLRIIEPSGGKIILDGIDVTTIGLEDLRTRVTIVSQDVSLFTGTVRSNLDPLGEHDDDECRDVLERCHLINRSDDGPQQNKVLSSLDAEISPSGSLSAGERQLVALARAILRRSQVIIMDEATSQIDIQLDDQIQRTIREELSRATVITIAHRLKTIIDYDRILVLGNGGQVVEFDSPKALLSRGGGEFREMCLRSTDWDELKQMSENAH